MPAIPASPCTLCRQRTSTCCGRRSAVTEQEASKNNIMAQTTTANRSNGSHSRYALPVLLATTILLDACATVTVPTSHGDKTMTVGEFSEYAESVFRRQNRASTQVIMLADAVDTATYSKLAAAERAMLEDCGPLNAIAARERDRQSVGLTLKLEIAPTIDACDRATQRLEAMLRALNQ